MMPTRRYDPLNARHAQSRHAQQQLAIGAVDIEREQRAMLQRPGELRVYLEIEETILNRDLARVEAIKSYQPIGLIEPVLAHQRWRL